MGNEVVEIPLGEMIADRRKNQMAFLKERYCKRGHIKPVQDLIDIAYSMGEAADDIGCLCATGNDYCLMAADAEKAMPGIAERVYTVLEKLKNVDAELDELAAEIMTNAVTQAQEWE